MDLSSLHRKLRLGPGRLQVNRACVVVSMLVMVLLFMLVRRNGLTAEEVRLQRRVETFLANGLHSAFPAPKDRMVDSKYVISPFLRQMGLEYQGAATSHRILAGGVPLGYDTVIDVGAFDGLDVTIPAFKKGYSVYAFEFDPKNQALFVQTMINAGMRPGVDFSVILVSAGSAPKIDVKPGPHVYFIKAGAYSRNTGFSVDHQRGYYEMAQVGEPSDDGGMPVVRVDDVVPTNANVLLFKIDVQGSEAHVLEGSTRVLSQKHLAYLSMEYWPEAIREQKSDPVALLKRVIDAQFICYDVGALAYTIPVDRPSGIEAYTAFLESIPYDINSLSGWEELFCRKIGL